MIEEKNCKKEMEKHKTATFYAKYYYVKDSRPWGWGCRHNSWRKVKRDGKLVEEFSLERVENSHAKNYDFCGDHNPIK